MILVDTGAWFARIVPSDANHRLVGEWMRRNQQKVITTDYVIDETLTLLRARGEHRRAMVLGEAFFDGSVAAIYYLTEDDVRQAWRIFQEYSDKAWSFTDCTSKVVIEKLGITHALSFDTHFRQFGSVIVVP